MAKPPGYRDHHPGWPRPAPHNHHPGLRLRAALLIHAKGTQARDENVRITAAVRMMRPDEIPAAALSITHLPIRLNRVTAPSMTIRRHPALSLSSHKGPVSRSGRTRVRNSGRAGSRCRVHVPRTDLRVSVQILEDLCDPTRPGPVGATPRPRRKTAMRQQAHSGPLTHLPPAPK